MEVKSSQILLTDITVNLEHVYCANNKWKTEYKNIIGTGGERVKTTAWCQLDVGQLRVIVTSYGFAKLLRCQTMSDGFYFLHRSELEIYLTWFE